MSFQYNSKSVRQLNPIFSNCLFVSLIEVDVSYRKMNSGQSCGNQPFALSQPWTPAQVASSVMKTIPTVATEEVETFCAQFVMSFVLFLHELILHVADEALDWTEPEQNHEDEDEEIMDEDEEEEMNEDDEEINEDNNEDNNEDDNEDEDVFEDVFAQNPQFLTYIFGMLDKVTTRVAERYAPELAQLCGIDCIRIVDLLARHEDISPAATYQLVPDFSDRCIKMVAQVYEDIVLQLDMDARPSMVALAIWKRADGEKAETDIEDEHKIAEYILQHSSDLMQLEIKTMQSIVREKLEENKVRVQQFVLQHGPSYVEALVQKTLLPMLDSYSG